MLARKLRRDLWRTKAQVGAVGITIVLGVALFAASWDAFNNLSASYERTYERLALADFSIDGGDQAAIAEAAATIDGVAGVAQRTVSDVPMEPVPGHRLFGRVVGMPADTQPEVNRIDMVAGEYLRSDNPNGVVVEQSFAEHFHFSVGEVVSIGGSGHEIVGIATSPEYIVPSRSRQDVIATPDDFGVAFATESTIAEIGGQRASEANVVYDAGVSEQTRLQLDSMLESVAADLGATSWYTREEQPSNAALQTDLQGFEELAVAFPALFLTAAGMATLVLLTRIVGRERGVLGTLRANGLGRRTVLRHYLAYGAVVGLAGSVIGIAIGIPLARAITGLYTSFLAIPDTVVEFRPTTLLVALAFGPMIGLIAAWIPARSAFRLSPAEAMRGEVPTGSGGRSLVEHVLPRGSLPARWRMQLRSIGRSKRRSLSTVLGVVLALVLILVSWGMIDTMTILVDRQFTEIQREDAQLWFDTAVDDARVASVGAQPGVERAEPVSTLLVKVRSGSEVYGTVLNAFEPDTEMHGFRLSNGDLVELPAQGAYAGQALADELGVSKGDQIEVGVSALGESFEVELVDFVDEAFGTFVYMSRPELAAQLSEPRTIDLPGIGTSMVRYADGVDRDLMRGQLSSLENVAAFSDSRSMYELMQDSLALFYVFVGVMLVFGGAMAFALMFNTMSVNIAERAGELATLRANGLGRRRLARLITAENVLLSALGIVPGLILGYYVCVAFLDGFSSDLFQFQAEFRGMTFVFASIAIIVVALVSQWPGLRAIQRQSIAVVVRERSL